VPEIFDYDRLADANTGPPPGGFPQTAQGSQWPGMVRELMARAKRLFDDISGKQKATGSGGNYAVASAMAPDLAKGFPLLFRANHENPAAGPTLTVGSSGQRALVYADGSTIPAGAIKAGQLCHVAADPDASRWNLLLVPASAYSGTVTGSQITLEGQAQGAIAIRGTADWRASAIGTAAQYLRGGPNPSWATPTGLPGQAKLACRVGASATLAQISGTGYTAVASTYGTGLYRLVFTPELPATFIPQLTFQGPTQRMVHIVSAVAGQIEFRVATTIVVPGGQNSVESNTINNGVGGAATNLGGSDFVHVVIF